MFIKFSYPDDFQHLMLDLRDKYDSKFLELSGISDDYLDITKYSKNYFLKKHSADTTMDQNANVRANHIGVYNAERFKGHSKLNSLFLLWTQLKKLYGTKEANRLIEDEFNKSINIQDGYSSYLPYCYNFATYDLIFKGLPFITGVQSAPAKHADTFIQHVIQLCMFGASDQLLGATSIGDFLIVYSYLLKKDSLNNNYFTPNYIENPEMFDIYIRQELQKFVYTINQPVRKNQSIFTNITIFDSIFLKELQKLYIFEEGESFDLDFTMMIQKKFLKFFNEYNRVQLFTFPVLSAQIKIDEENEVEDEDFFDFICETNLDFANLNIFGSNNLQALSSCCFDGDQKILVKSSISGVYSCSFKEFKDLPYAEYKSNLKIAHNGTWVSGKLIETPLNSKKMYSITTVNNKKICVTDDHIHLTLNGDKKTTELTEDDYLVFNYNVFDSIPEQDKNLTYEQGVLIGAYLGDGSKFKKKNCNSAHIDFSLNEEKYNTLLPIFSKALQDFNINVPINLGSPYNNVYPMSMNSVKLCEQIEYWVKGNYCYEKELNLNCLTQSIDFRRGILDGFYITDGGNSNRIYTTSKKLVEQTEMLIMSLGMVSIIDESDRTDEPVIIRGNSYNRNHVLYCIRFYTPKHKRIQPNVYKIYNNSIGFKIKSIEEIKNYSEKNVYCFEIKNEDEPYFTLPNGIITHNCRLQSNVEDILNNMKNENTNLIGGSTLKVGSFGVTTINLPRIACNNKGNKEDFFKEFEERIIDCIKMNHARRELIKTNIERDQLPLYTHDFIRLDTQYSTVGYIGFYECIDLFGLDILTEEGKQFGLEINDCLTRVINDKAKKLLYKINCEQIPGESTSIKFAQADQKLNKQNKYNLYSNQYIPLIAEADILDRIELQALFEKANSGGSILHLNVGEKIKSKEVMKKLIAYTLKKGVTYFAINYFFSECEDKHMNVSVGDRCVTCGKNIIEKYTRIVGFIVPISSWSKERREEGKERKVYTTKQIDIK